MKKILYSIVLVIMVMSIIGCDNTKTSGGYRQDIPGESVGLVLLWVIDENDEATRGSAPFELYDDNGTYYVEFYGEVCKLKRISPIDVGGTVLCYEFTTQLGTYYLEDISESSNRL